MKTSEGGNIVAMNDTRCMESMEYEGTIMTYQKMIKRQTGADDSTTINICAWSLYERNDKHTYMQRQRDKERELERISKGYAYV